MVTLEDYLQLHLQPRSNTDDEIEAEFLFDDDEVQLPAQNEVFNPVRTDEPNEEIDEAVDHVMLSLEHNP